MSSRERSAVLRSFIREKSRSHSDVSSGMRSMSATSLMTCRYSSVKPVSMRGHSNLNLSDFRPRLALPS